MRSVLSRPFVEISEQFPRFSDLHRRYFAALAHPFLDNLDQPFAISAHFSCHRSSYLKSLTKCHGVTQKSSLGDMSSGSYDHMRAV